MFQGEFNNSIDPKGRTSIPAKLREVLGDVYGDECLVVTKNQEGGLSAYPQSSWEKKVEELNALPASPQKNALFRLIFAPATVCSFDKQGRVLIPPSLRSHAALEKDVVVVGLFDKIEIYSQVCYAEVTRKSEAVLQSDPQLVAEMGF